MYNIQNLKQDLTGIIHGTTLNKIVNLDPLIDRAARTLLLDVDPQETIRISQFVNPIYTDVFNYALPADVKGNKIIDIRPQVNRLARDVYNQDYSQQFDLSKQNIYALANQFNVQFNSSVKTILINAPFNSSPVPLNQAASIAGNGTWVVGGGADALSVDNVNYVAGAGSLEFNLLASQASGSLENSTFSALDLSEVENQSTLFLYTYLPLATSFTSVNLQWGTDSSNYYTRTVTVNQANTAFQNGWNLLAFNWDGATVVGTPNSASIGYLKVTWNYDSTLQTGVHLNNITSNLGAILEIVYYSKYLFRDSSTGAYIERVTDDSNLINLDVESYNLLLDQVCYIVSQQTQGANSGFDAPFWEKKYLEDKMRYQAMYKSQVQKPKQIYYKQPNPNYSKYWTRWNN